MAPIHDCLARPASGSLRSKSPRAAEAGGPASQVAPPLGRQPRPLGRRDAAMHGGLSLGRWAAMRALACGNLRIAVRAPSCEDACVAGSSRSCTVWPMATALPLHGDGQTPGGVGMTCIVICRLELEQRIVLGHESRVRLNQEINTPR